MLEQHYEVKLINYRAMLCISAVFAVGRCPSGCPSVCPSDTFAYCIQMAEVIVKRLSRPGSLISLVFFLSQLLLPNSKGNPFSRGVKYTFFLLS